MKDIKALLGKYLQRPTQYAVLLSGPWGIGKTHYYKNILHPLIS